MDNLGCFYFRTKGLKSSHAALQENIIDENKKYIVAIFNIIGENKKYDGENISVCCGVGRFIPLRELLQREAEGNDSPMKAGCAVPVLSIFTGAAQPIDGRQTDNRRQAKGFCPPPCPLDCQGTQNISSFFWPMVFFIVTLSPK